MSALRRLGSAARSLLAAVLCWHAVAGHASDVPYVPTPMNVVDAMLAMGGVGPDDFLVDLGSGDGRIAIRAATRFGTRGMGVDLDDNLVRMARADAGKQGVQDKVTFEARDLFDTDISRATVVTAYLLNSVNLRLRPRLFEQLRPGTRIVTHDFDFGNWQPDQKVTIDVPDKAYGPPRSDIMLWVVPADCAGTWQWSPPGAADDARYEARLEQKFQLLEGTVIARGQRVRLGEARVRGNTVSFTLTSAAGGQRYSGQISGDSIAGQVVLRSGEPPVPWQAVRIKTGKMDISAGATLPVVAGSLIKEQ
jgi:Methyltransferase domain